MAVLPSVGRSRGDVGTDDNLLFFGIFTSLREAEFSDRMMALVSDADALCRAMLRDMYHNGQVLQRRKYSGLGYSSRLFLAGVVTSIFALVGDLGLGAGCGGRVGCTHSQYGVGGGGIRSGGGSCR